MTRRRKRNNTDIIIIGGGASGLAAACVCAQAGARTLLAERQDRVGRKLLATGSGRCNLLNTGPPVYFGDAAFARRVLSSCHAQHVMDFFGNLGLTFREEEGGLVYPASGRASEVLDVLRLPLEASPHVTVMTGTEVVDLSHLDGELAVTTRDDTVFAARCVIAAGGGPAAPRLGGTYSLYAMLERLGHTVVPPKPALTSLKTAREGIRGLSGLRVNAVCTLADGDTSIETAQGEVLFTDYGVSGVCVMQLSRTAGALLAAGKTPVLYLDFSPLMGLAPFRWTRLPVQQPGLAAPAALAWLTDRAERLPERQLLVGAFPRLLADRLSNHPLPRLAELATGYPLSITGVRGFEHAQVTAGGIDTADIDPATMASRLVSRLYLAGELLNVDGDCGGYNLLFAWASGITAARAALNTVHAESS
ncbi:MAG: aminoacetone oxidase family FAD-binding enzyme [Christensenellales bacterium]|jgi:predicted Rossmann fold flavoprotein